MFLKLLKKLVDEYADQPSYMGGDLEEDLARSLPFDVIVPRRGMMQALYDLGVLVALEPPYDGEVAVNTRLASALLRVVKTRRIDRCLACKGCGQDVDPDATKLAQLAGFMPNPAGGADLEIRDVYAFCPDCAAKAGPEWVKP